MLTSKLRHDLGQVLAVAIDAGLTEDELQGMVKIAVASHQLSQVLVDALDSGTTEEEILEMVQAATANRNSSQAESANPVYSELPDGLIDLPAAAQKYGLNRATIRYWLTKGRIRSRGRLKAPATGGGYLVVDEEELLAYMSAPRLVGGRPRKQAVAISAEAPTSGATEEKQTSPERVLYDRSMPLTGVLNQDNGSSKTVGGSVYAELPPGSGLIDVPTAAQIHGIPRRTIQSWLRKKKVALHGRLQPKGWKRSYLVVREAELISYAEAPKDRGGRPRTKT